MQKVFIILCAVFLTSCTTQNTKDLVGYSLVEANSYENPIPKLDSTTSYGTIVVRRDSGFTGSALPAKLHLNGTKICNLRPGQYVELKVKSGEHQLALNSNGFALLPVETKAVTNIEIGSRQYFRVLPIWGGGMQIRTLDE